MFEDQESHPSYGMIGISHASSPGTHLVGSDFRHNHFVTLQIHRAVKHRDLARDWWHARETLIEVALTEAQLVELIGRPNMGDGVPCSLRRVMGEAQEPPPPPKDRKGLGHHDLNETAGKLQSLMKETLINLESAASEGKIGKKQLDRMIHSLRCGIENFAPNMEFVRNSFDKAMDETINRAGVEIEATIAQTAMRLGLERMREIGTEAPKLIELEGGKSE